MVHVWVWSSVLNFPEAIVTCRLARCLSSGILPLQVVQDAYTALEAVVASTNMTEQHVAALAELPEVEPPPDSKGEKGPHDHDAPGRG
jgi:hypothetical protein